jgi:hypothetical protein
MIANRIGGPVAELDRLAARLLPRKRKRNKLDRDLERYARLLTIDTRSLASLVAVKSLSNEFCREKVG